MVSASLSASIPFTSTSADSSIQAFEGNFDFSDFERSGLVACLFEPELEPITLYVINEPEVEDDMTTDLRVDFKERHHKCLHEAIEVVALPAKRACPEGV